jgi:hypothetical protein
MQYNEITDEYDKEFISLMLTIEKRSEILNKYDKLRIKNWCKKLCQVTNNVEWKKNRNLHAICILDSILNEHFEEPYNKFPPEGSVPILNKTLVKSKLSMKFFEETLNMQKSGEQIEQEEMDNLDNNEKINFSSNKKKNINDNLYLKNLNNENNQNNKIINEQKKEINRLNELLGQKDKQINSLLKEKNQMISRIEELEQMLSKFMEIEKSEE